MSGVSYSWTLVQAATTPQLGLGQARLYAFVEYRDTSADRIRTTAMQRVYSATSQGVVGGSPNFGEALLASTAVVGAQASVAAAGAGLCPAGTSPCGIGRLAVSSAPPSRAIAPRAVCIDQTSLDVVLDDLGRELSMSPTDQRVLLLLNTEAGSRKIDPSGFRRPRRLTASVERETRDAIKEALKPVIDDHSIELVSVTTYYG